MDALWIITVFDFVDEVMRTLGHHSHVLAVVPDSEVLTVAIVAAKYFQNHHERAVCLMAQTGYLSGALSVSRFNRRLHRLASWLPFLVESLGEVWTRGEVFIIDSVPLPAASSVRKLRSSVDAIQGRSQGPPVTRRDHTESDGRRRILNSGMP